MAVERAKRRRSRLVPIAAATLILGALAGWLVARRTGGVAQPKFQRLTFQRGTVIAARFGPDGHTVYYSASWDGVSPKVFLLRPGNPESSALALPPANLFGISSAGEFALQLDAKPAPQGFGFIGTLARAPLSGGAPKEILQDVTYAEWAPAGADLAIVHRVAGKDRLEYPVGKILYETGGWIQGPRFSRDGTLIAFIHHPASSDSGAVTLVDLAGKSRNLADGWATVQGLAWGPEKEIWFTAVREGIQREIYSVTTGGKLRLVRTMQGTPALLDIFGSSALVTEDDYRSGILAFLTNDASSRDLGWFDWSNDRGISDDGKLVLLDESGEGGGPRSSAYVRPTDGSPAVRLSDGVGISLSRDGAWAITRPGNEASSAHFILVPVRAGQSREFPPDPFGSAPYGVFFPDGSRFAFVAAESGHAGRLYVQSVSGGSATPISAEGVNPGRIYISPDARFLAATGPDQTIHLYPTGGGNPVDLPSAKRNDIPAGFTSDGKGLYVSQIGSTCGVYLIDLGSGSRTHVRDLGGVDASGVIAVGPARVTPDGKTAIAGYGRILSTLYKVTDLR